jgi:hypothetical protein
MYGIRTLPACCHPNSPSASPQTTHAHAINAHAYACSWLSAAPPAFSFPVTPEGNGGTCFSFRIVCAACSNNPPCTTASHHTCNRNADNVSHVRPPLTLLCHAEAPNVEWECEALHCKAACLNLHHSALPRVCSRQPSAVLTHLNCRAGAAQEHLWNPL